MQFLRYVSGAQGMIRIVIAGMLADAALECLHLTRQMDTEDT